MTGSVVAYRLHIGPHGKLYGRAWITHNRPWPAVNGQGGLTPPMNGAVMHTMVGDLPGTVAVFNRPGFSASAHFGIGGKWSQNDGHIHQFGPARDWEAWHVENGNNMWWGIEHEDGGDPARPLTDAQLTASAQVLEALAAQDGGWGFPLEVTDSTDGHGYAAHYIGGAGWGGHTCPDNAPGGQGPRSHQRHEIVRRARILREHGQYPVPPVTSEWTADGTTTLGELAAHYNVPPATIVRLSADPAFNQNVAHWLDGVLTGVVPPAGTVLAVPAGGSPA